MLKPSLTALRKLMDFITNNQIFIISACFAIGLLATISCMRRSHSGRLWQLADLSWVLFGGFGALTAILAGLYQDDSTRLHRQIDVAYSASAAFDRDAARFRLRYCDHTRAPDTDLDRLCEKVEFLSASTASNAALPLFISLTQDTANRSGLYLFSPGTASAARMEDQIEELDTDSFLSFDTMDPATVAASKAIQAQDPQISADFQILTHAYDDLITQVQRLKSEYDLLVANAGILALQIMGLCLVALTAPFRLGKSIVDLNKANKRRQARIAAQTGQTKSD